MEISSLYDRDKETGSIISGNTGTKVKRIKLIGVGGTIVSRQSENGFVPDMTPKELISMIPELEGYCEIIFEEVMNTDSSNLQPEDWGFILPVIVNALNDKEVDGIVVIHGTDTMTFTASATAIFVRNINKPIVFTGSQIPWEVFGSDARRNIIDAFRIATETDIIEPVIVFNSRVYRATRTVKLREYDLSAFESVDNFPVAEISRTIDMVDPFIKLRSEQTENAYVDGEISASVALLRVFPGMDPMIFEHIVKGGYKGIIVEGYGAGNLPIKERSLLDKIKSIVDRGIPVVITTQCVFGRTEALYETNNIFVQNGAINGKDMISETALIKLIWALGKGQTLGEIKEKMYTNLAGEIKEFIN